MRSATRVAKFIAMRNDLLLLHGALGDSAQLAPLAAALATTTRVRSFDFHGHGHAPANGRPYRIESFAEDVVSFLERERLEKVDVFGYSMGGYVAVYLAANGFDRITRVATLGTKFWWDPATAAKEADRLDAATIRAKVPKFGEALERRHRDAGGWETVVARTADCLRALGEHPLLDDAALTRIMIPVCTMVGDRDATVSVEETAAVSGLLRSGELVVLTDTPHPIEQVDVDGLAARLLSWRHPEE